MAVTVSSFFYLLIPPTIRNLFSWHSIGDDQLITSQCNVKLSISSDRHVSFLGDNAMTSVSDLTSRSLPCQGGHDGTVARGPQSWWSSLKCILWQSIIWNCQILMYFSPFLWFLLSPKCQKALFDFVNQSYFQKKVLHTLHLHETIYVYVFFLIHLFLAAKAAQ